MDINELIVEAIREKKGYKIVKIDIGELTSIADSFIICSGATPVQTKAIFSNIKKKLKGKAAISGTEGEDYGQWILMDYYETIIHIFTDAMRDKYNLELLWADGDFHEYDSEE